MLIFNMGNGYGLLKRKSLVWHNPLAFIVKDWIDHRFMSRFQICGEQNKINARP